MRFRNLQYARNTANLFVIGLDDRGRSRLSLIGTVQEPEELTLVMTEHDHFLMLPKTIQHNTKLQSLRVICHRGPNTVTTATSTNNTTSNVVTLINVRQLRGESWSLASDLILNYVMNVFPNIQYIWLSMRPLNPEALTVGLTNANVSTSTAIQFLNYLSKMSTVHVDDICVAKCE